MRINRFKIGLILRILLLSGSIFAFSYFSYEEGYLITSIILVCFIIIQIYFLIVYTDRTNRELARFFNSIKLSDFSSSFANNSSSSFKELNESLASVINQFNITRSEKEENFQYLQTVVRHIGMGLISFKSDGKIELINTAAKKMLGKADLINISGLASVNGNLVDVLQNIKTGEKTLVKLENKNSTKQLSISAAEFKMQNELYKLVSFQDISSELERERMSNELDIAHNIQMKLLPKQGIQVPGYSIDALCIPAKEVGGDYYDFISFGNGKYGFVIGDVAGKGMPAAIYMTLTKGIFQSFAEENMSPKEVLKRVNSLMYKIIERNYFVTILYALLDTKTNKFAFARAGHEPLIFLNRSEDKISLIRPDGLGIGLEKGKIFDTTIEEHELMLNQGDMLLIYTDGITDLKNKENISFGTDRIIKIVSDHKNNSSPELVKNLYIELNRFKNDFPQYDDMTMIAVKRD
ncbi:MAG: SpoIIE family protein phosphatase [Ignavibacteriaceae bacterium]